MKLVGNEDEASFVRGQLTECCEQLVDLLGGEDGRRFVEDEQLRLAVQRLDDLDALTFANRQLLHQYRRIEVEPIPPGEIVDPLGHHIEISDKTTTR